MKRKVLSIFIALVLALSLCLVTAVPAGATGAIGEPFFTTDNLGTVEWSTEQPEVGDYSVKLSIPPYDPGRLYDEARVVFNYDGDLNSITGVSYPSYVIGGNDGDLYPMVVLAVDSTGDESVDSWVCQWGPYEHTALENDWETISFDGGFPVHVAGARTDLPGDHYLAYTNPFTDSDTLDLLKAEWGAYTVLEVKVFMGMFTNLTQEMTAYVDDVTINEVTYELEPRVINIDAIEGFNTIQAAIDDPITEGGDTINVAAGTYTEHITIAGKSNLTIQSTEDAEIVPTSTPWITPIIKVDSSTDITIRGLVIDGKDEVDPFGYSWGGTPTAVGILFEDSTGTIEGNEIRNFNLDSYPVDPDNPALDRRGTPVGTGIIVLNNCPQVTIEGNVIKSYHASGIRLCYGVEGNIINIIDNVITGRGPQSFYSGESIRIDAASTVNIIGNELSNNIYIDDDYCEGDAAGVTIDGKNGGLPEVNITENDIRNNTFGIIVQRAEGAVVEAHFNNIVGNGVLGTAPNRGGAAAQDVKDGTGEPHVWPINTKLNATKNWWGNASGPDGDQNFTGETYTGPLPGTGDRVFGNVKCMPWLTKPFEKVLGDGIAYFGVSFPALKGWNIVSTPLALDADVDGFKANTWDGLLNIGKKEGEEYALNLHYTVVKGVGDEEDWKDYTPIYYYDSDPASGVNFGWRQVTEFTNEINPLDAFYIRMKESDSFPVLFSPDFSVPSKELYQGWNLVGCAYMDVMFEEGGKQPLVETALATIVTVSSPVGDVKGYSQVVSPPVNQPPWIFIPPPPLNGTLIPLEADSTILMGKGYWVFMENPGTLAGLTFTPISLPKP